jgi:hypothetical protein
MPWPLRLTIGFLLIFGGFFWFLPILGLWMVPLGLLVLSVDFQWARRGYLSVILWLRRLRDRQRARKRQRKERKLRDHSD